MIVKYKVSDFAKDLNLSAKKVLDELAAMGSTGKKNSSNLEENELNYLLEKFSKDNSVKSLDEFLNSAKAPKAEPKPAEKKAEPKAEKKPEAPKAPKAEPAKAEAKPAAKQNNKKNEQHKKREEKTVSLSELARETGAKATAASAQSVSVRREDNQVTVDTRTVDMNVDRFDARYDDLASTKNTENRRKPTPQGNKQKFTQRGQRQPRRRPQIPSGPRQQQYQKQSCRKGERYGGQYAHMLSPFRFLNLIIVPDMPRRRKGAKKDFPYPRTGSPFCRICFT